MAARNLLFAILLLVGVVYCLPALASEQIGAVEKTTGECLVIRDTKSLKAEPGQPVLVKDEISTGKGARISIVFLDETKLTLDESSHASIDNYIYSDDKSDLLFKFTKGTFRTITGGIVKQNPEGFNMETPLASLGIRGSDIYAIVQPDGEEAGALHLGENHALEVKTSMQTVRITESGMRVRISPTGLIFTPSRIPPSMFNNMLNLGSAPQSTPPSSGAGAAAPAAQTRSGTDGQAPKPSSGVTAPLKRSTGTNGTLKLQTPTKTAPTQLTPRKQLPTVSPSITPTKRLPTNTVTPTRQLPTTTVPKTTIPTTPTQPQVQPIITTPQLTQPEVQQPQPQIRPRIR